MSDTALQTEAGASEQAVVPSTAGEVASGQSGAVSFAEVVGIHFEWERAVRRGTPDDELEQRFRDKLREFQQKEGTLLHAYWSRRRLGRRAEVARAPAQAADAQSGGRCEGRARRPKKLTDADAIIRAIGVPMAPRESAIATPDPLRHAGGSAWAKYCGDERAHRDAVDLRRPEPCWIHRRTEGRREGRSEIVTSQKRECRIEGSTDVREEKTARVFNSEGMSWRL